MHREKSRPNPIVLSGVLLCVSCASQRLSQPLRTEPVKSSREAIGTICEDLDRVRWQRDVMYRNLQAIRAKEMLDEHIDSGLSDDFGSQALVRHWETLRRALQMELRIAERELEILQRLFDGPL